MYGCGKDCLILIPFRLPQISFFTFNLQRFSFDSDNCPGVEIRPLLQFPHPPKAGPVLLTLLFFSPSSFVLPSLGWLYIFFSTGQVLLSALRWCSAYTSVSEGAFQIYPWREIYSTSTYSSTILLFHSSIFAWWICMDRGAWQATIHGITELDMTEQLSTAHV